MNCNMASSFQWDWEALVMSNPSKTENEKKQPSTDWELESMIPDFLGFERPSSGSATSFWHTATAKSSLSTSINSSSPEFKPRKLASERSPGNSCSNIDFSQVKASKDLEVSVASAESDLCLKLGKRTKSEEFLGRNNNDVSAVSMKLLTPSVVTRKNSKSCGQSMQVPRCQIDGCYLDLTSGKDYHRKHGVCENHSKCPKVIVSGLECRFCQQCSRFHAVAEFDDKKRSCRKRLSHHNARRRKRQGTFSRNLERVNDRRQHSSMLWNGLPLNTKSEETYLWGTTYETKPTQVERGFTLSFKRGNGYEEQLFASNNLSFSTFQTSSKFSPRKSNIQLPEKGLGEYSGALHESHDFYSALSLLSTSSDPRGTTKHNNPVVEPQPIFGTIPTHFI